MCCEFPFQMGSGFSGGARGLPVCGVFVVSIDARGAVHVSARMCVRAWACVHGVGGCVPGCQLSVRVCLCLLRWLSINIFVSKREHEELLAVRVPPVPALCAYQKHGHARAAMPSHAPSEPSRLTCAVRPCCPCVPPR